MVEEKEKEVKEQSRYELIEVPTQLGVVIQSPEKTQLSVELALVEMLNKLDDIKTLVG